MDHEIDKMTIWSMVAIAAKFEDTITKRAWRKHMSTGRGKNQSISVKSGKCGERGGS